MVMDFNSHNQKKFELNGLFLSHRTIMLSSFKAFFLNVVSSKALKTFFCHLDNLFYLMILAKDESLTSARS